MQSQPFARRYATAFAAVGKPIPCCLTAIADEFGGPVPCGGYAQIGSDAIGRELLAAIGDSPAVLMRQHGVFTIGSTINKALQAAVMVEDVAHTVFTAMHLGQIEELPAAGSAGGGSWAPPKPAAPPATVAVTT